LANISTGTSPLLAFRFPFHVSRLEFLPLTFLRQAALLLPSAFLLGALLFLLVHGHADPGFGTYPFFEQWHGGKLMSASPEARFVEQSLLFFVPAYAVCLLFILGVSAAEKAVFRPGEKRAPSAYGRVFGPTFAVVFLIASAFMVFAGERLAARVAPGALVAPVLVGFAPFAAALFAVIPAALLALPLLAVRRRSET
jgi:hypothetical protein